MLRGGLYGDFLKSLMAKNQHWAIVDEHFIVCWNGQFVRIDFGHVKIKAGKERSVPQVIRTL